jgi:hypothetical protein
VIDGSGNPSVAGFFSGTVDFNPGAGVDNRTSNGIRDVFLSGFDSNGNLVWARTWGGPGDDGGTSVAIDGSGNAYITGFFEGTANFDPGAGTDNHTSNGEEDAFLSKFDQNGNFIWALSWGGSSIDVGGSVAIDGSGNMYIRGDFMNTVDFDPGAGTDTHSSNGYYDVFLSKFDSNGNFVWARTWGESGIDLGGSAAIDGSGNVYVTGEFEGTVDFDPGVGVDNHSSNGITDIFLSKYDPNGNLVWARTWGGSYDDWGLSVMIDGSGNAYATGSFGDIVEFDPGAGVENHTSNGDYDAFLSKFLPNGNW